MSEIPQTTQRADEAGLAGYGCLVSLVLAGFIGGLALGFWGVSALIRGGREPLESTAEAVELVDSLEVALALSAAGALLFLIGIVSSVVLLKSLSDDTARRQRGPIRE